ncbi:AraC family transcriptional regulator [Prevotella sp. oral taxon 376]|uniref:helix-turn-helix transcriptional regulator n=1 Tax=Prevotella sp. oral taxon 376 TaxID=712466 RepID=UPI000D1D7E77|nr:helix-turn-helix domain-containing protein [Prevotella sp. oral taxon 376]PTL33880.1 AraC family transcriptional regulator [Prevotella sp. oral taxon 376]
MKHSISICACNKLFDEKALHPLASVINLSTECKEEAIRLDCYAILLRRNEDGERRFGRQACDFSDATLLFRSPEKTLDLEKDSLHEHKGKLLMFHPDLFCGTPLGQQIKDFNFFRYRQDESLHISRKERKAAECCIDGISRELEWGIDQLTASILCDLITQLLHHCQRFYQRQFITREIASERILTRFMEAVDEYLQSGRIQNEGQPGASVFTDPMNISTAYLNDLLKHATGKEFDGYFQSRRIEMAKRLMATDDDEKISQKLGFKSSDCFHSLFQRITGISIQEYRN